MTKFSFSQRFIGLTVVGYLTAVAAAAVAVWIASGPVLKDWQDRTIQEHAEANAQSVRIVLRKLGFRTQAMTTNSDIVKVTIGDEFNLDRARDQLQSLGALGDFISVYVVDFAGDIVLSEELASATRTSFSAIDYAEIANEMLADDSQEFRFSFRPSPSDNKHHFIVAQPIRSNGLVEGILIAEFALAASETITEKTSIGTAQIATAFQVKILEDTNSGAVSLPVEGTDFFIALHPDSKIVQSAGVELVDRVLTAVGIFLIAPFFVMGLAGRRSIVKPHKALEVSQAALRENQKKLRELADIAERSNDCIISTNLEGRMTWVNRAFTEITGFSSGECLGRTPGEVLQGPDTDRSEAARIGAAIARREPIRAEILNYFKNGEPYWNAISIAPQVDEDGEPYGFVAISTDVTKQREVQDKILKAKAQIEHQANHDALTGLPNRRALDAELDRLKQQEHPRVLVRIDLDHFKNVNDTLGHAAGDHVLKIVSDLLLSHVRLGDMAARVGGDEFVILMDQASDTSDAVALSERLLKEIQKEIIFEGKPCRIGASFGVAAAGNGMLSNNELLIGADSALYVAKSAGRNCVVSYSKDLHDKVVAGRRVAKEIESAITNREFEPFFQPQFDAKTFEFKGVETLVRWRHPTRGILPPADFLDIAEQLSVASDMDAIVLERGLHAVNELNRAGIHIPKVSFNVVASRLEEPDLPDIIHQLSFDGTMVCFEVLESVLVEEQTDLFQSRVDLLREIGFGIEVDDFGSGHASIIGLTKLAPDVMKIDQRLVFPIIESSAARNMIRAIIEIGRSLDISVTAEGVETAQHAKTLADVGCNTLQGYYFAKPMCADGLKRFLTEYDAEAFRQECFEQSARRLTA